MSLNHLRVGIVSGLAAFYMMASLAVAAEYRGKVVRVIDGDTLEIRHDGLTERIHLRGIDCPEMKQPYGKHAKRAVDALVSGSMIGVRTYGKDGRGRMTADVFLEDGRNVSRILLQDGLAWRIPSAAADSDLDAAAADAQYSKRGLWSEPHPMAPWVYRTSKGRKHP